MRIGPYTVRRIGPTAALITCPALHAQNTCKTPVYVLPRRLGLHSHIRNGRVDGSWYFWHVSTTNPVVITWAGKQKVLRVPGHREPIYSGDRLRFRRLKVEVVGNGRIGGAA